MAAAIDPTHREKQQEQGEGERDSELKCFRHLAS